MISFNISYVWQTHLPAWVSVAAGLPPGPSKNLGPALSGYYEPTMHFQTRFESIERDVSRQAVSLNEQSESPLPPGSSTWIK